MRRERLYLWDIVQAADHIALFISDINFEQFQESELIRSAVVQKLSVIGQAAGRISPELTGRHAEIPWPQIVAFRNIIVHAYFGINWEVVWQSAAHLCPTLRTQVATILTAEFEPIEGLN